MYPLYVPGVLHGLMKHTSFGVGLGYGLAHPEVRYFCSHVEMTIHEAIHAVLLWEDADPVWRRGPGRSIDIRRISSREIRKALNRRTDRPRQECITLAAEYWILRHWGFKGTPEWLPEVIRSQPAQVTVQRVMHHLTHPAKRSYTLRQAHRAMRLIRQSVQNWRRHERGSDQGT